MGVQIPVGAIFYKFEPFDCEQMARHNARANAATIFGDVIIIDKKLTGNAKQRRNQRRKIESTGGLVCLHRRGEWVACNDL